MYCICHHKVEDNLISKYAVFHKALVNTSIIKISFSSGSGGDRKIGIIFNPHSVIFSIWSKISCSCKVVAFGVCFIPVQNIHFSTENNELISGHILQL